MQHADGNVAIGSNGTIVHVAAGTYGDSHTCTTGYSSVFCEPRMRPAARIS